MIFFTSCGAILQKQGIKNFKDPITKTKNYKSLNKNQQDFIYLKTICEKNYPNGEKCFPKEERVRMENQILIELGKKEMTDMNFRLTLKKYISHYNNEHSWISLQGTTINEIYPFQPYYIDSSLYILNLTKNYNNKFIGQKIIAFNDIPIKNYEKLLLEFVSAENMTAKRKDIQYYWWNNPILHEFIKGEKIDSIKLSLENGQFFWLKKISNKKIDWQLLTKDFQEHPITKDHRRNFDYQIIDSLGITYFQFHECYDKIEIKEGIKTYVKPWLVPLANSYVNSQLRKKKPSKRLKKYFDPERPIFNEYISKMISKSNSKGISKLIIDLRNNNGGSEMICLQLLYHLSQNENLKDYSIYVQNLEFYNNYFNNNNEGKSKKDSLSFLGFRNSDKSFFDRITDQKSPYYIPKNRPIFKGEIVIIANYTTHSAGALFTTLLQDNKIGQVIGTEVSNNPTGASGWTPFKLPNSKIEASIASEYLVRPDSKKSEMFIPDIKLVMSVEDIFKGRDPLFEKAIEILKKEKSPAANIK